MNPSLEPAEYLLKFYLKTITALSLLLTFFHLFPKLLPGFLSIVVPSGYLLLSNNSLVQAVLICLLLMLIVGDIRRFSPVIRLFKWILVFVVIGSIFKIFKANGQPVQASFLINLIVYSILLLLLWILFRAAGKARYHLKYLNIQQFQTLEALAEVCISGDSNKDTIAIKPIEVAANVDQYLLSFRASSKWLMKLVLTGMELYPLFSLHPLLSLMLPDRRLQFLKKRFLTDLSFRGLPRWYRQFIQAGIRMAKQLCYMGYYSDERVFKSVGYLPFESRMDIKERKAIFPDNYSKANKLQVLTEKDLKTKDITADVVIVGSGAAASILALELIKAGRKVLLVERGAYERPDSFTCNEVDMVSRLYADGALQLSRDFRFQVFQGSCVGGSTVVNNAVCFKTPDYILTKWINELGVQIDRGRYEKSMEEIYRIMGVCHEPTLTINKYFNPGGSLFWERCKMKGYDITQADSVVANIKGCLGCGYCNIGCRYGKKLSMLDTVLPGIQLTSPGCLEIISGCEGISFDKNKKGNGILSLTGKFKSGRVITIRGTTFISSAGAISSSILLLKSKLGLANAGKKLAFNLGTQITALYDKVVNSYDGLQISHFLKTDDRRFVMETWFNPPMFQSTAMPGWFDQHFHNMLQYSQMACTGVLVGTASNAEVNVSGLLGRNINYVPTEEDFDSLIDGLEKAAEIYLEDGVKRVMPNTFNYYEYTNTKDLKENLRKNIKSSIDISTGTGHPQGGNVMSNDPKTGVVDQNFKAFGYDNLYVCDASVFPTSLGVNPQITVMSMAHYAAPVIAANVTSASN
ncbi:MAG: hypothetical protein NVS9B7_29210 [Flavisolibacter sp.]